MALTDKSWHVYIGGTWIGTLSPSGIDGAWTVASFSPGDGWGNFAPWFEKAYQAFSVGDDAAWQTTYQQLTIMKLTITADDGESHANPTVHINGGNAWFAV